MRAIFSLLSLAGLMAGTSALALDTTTSLLLGGEARSLAGSSVNPGNRVARLPSSYLQAELRMDVKEYISIFDLTLRPRAEGGVYRVRGENEAEGAAFFQEVFLRANLHDSFTLSAGRIQFGWGPAESITPTNWFMPEIQWQASPYFEQLGVYLGQANFSVGQGFSLVLLNEFQPLEDNWTTRKAVPEEVFKKRALAKAEWNWDNANYVLGLVGGRERKVSGELWRAGLYGSWTLSDAWQLYADGVGRELADGSWKPLTVAGLRYTFEGGAEFRLEGIYNGPGLSRGDRLAQEAQLSLLGDNTLRELLLERSQSLSGKEYAYGAFRWMNAPFFPDSFQNPLFYLRALHSMSDHSTSVIGGLEAGFLDSYSASLYGALALGPKNGELRRLFDGLVGAVVKIVF